MTKGHGSWQIPAKLLVAIRYGDLEHCQQLLQSGADSDQIFKINNVLKPALHIAVELCSFQFVKLLLENGCSVDRCDSMGRTALHIAIEMGYDRVAEFLLLNRADVNLQDNAWNCPLHFAVKRGSFYIAKYLIEKGAIVSRRNSSGLTPLAIACTLNTSYEIIILLLENGACAADTDPYGVCPLSYVLEAGNYKYKTVKLLLQNGARPDFMSSSRRAPIHLLILTNNEAKLKCLSLMLKAGCEVNLKTKEKQTPLHLAVQTQDIKAVKMLLRAGANPNTVDCLGVSPLSHAFSTRSKTLIFTLVDGGARMTIEQFDTMSCEYLTEREKAFLKTKLHNPMTLKELSRLTIWKVFGPYTSDWLNSYRDLIPATLLQFLQNSLD